MTGPGTLEAVLRRDRLAVGAALVLVIAASWAWLLAGAGTGMDIAAMTAMSGGAGIGDMAMAAMAPVPWSPGHAAVMVAMWWIMMIAMMLPSAAPMILLYALIDRRRQHRDAALLATGAFAAGYLLAWGGFSLAAALAQWALDRAGLMSPAMAATSVLLGGALLVGAGLYQMTPLKHACLRRCRSPVGFLARHWRDGRAGALRMGLVHGIYCLGCCWVLMTLLFFGGVMNLAWIIGLAVYVLVEKLAPAGAWLGRVGGGALIAWGAALIAAGA